DVQIACDGGDEPRLIDDARHIADRNAEAQRAGELEAVDVAQKVGAVVGARQELEPRPEVRMHGARCVLLRGDRPIALPPERDVLVNACELRLRRQVDAVAGARYKIVEAEASPAGPAVDLAVARQ